MTDSTLPPSASASPGPSRPRETVTGRAGVSLSPRERLIAAVADHLEQPYLSFPVLADGVWTRPCLFGSSMERMLIFPLYPLEHRGWSRTAAEVVLGIHDYP